MTQILFLGRMHLTTKFQQKALSSLKGISPKKIGITIKKPFDTLIVAVTSSNHENTKRNPLSIEKRVEALVPFLEKIGINYKIVPIPDIPGDNKWVDYIEKQIIYQSRGKLFINPENTVLFSSTPSVIKLFKKKKYNVILAEIRKNGTYKTFRPFEIINMLLSAKKNWDRPDAKWKRYTSDASIETYKKYGLGDIILEINHDLLTTSEGELSETRDFRTYGNLMDSSMPMKWKELSSFIKSGKIIDCGCGTGTLLYYLSEKFKNSEIIGLDLSREFLSHCLNQNYPHPNVYLYKKDISKKNFTSNSISTKIFSSILHEAYSYNNYNLKFVKQTIKNSYEELKKTGRIIIRDGVKPEKKTIYLWLNNSDGKIHPAKIKKLSTEARFLKFSKVFKKKTGIKYEIKMIDKKKYYKLSVQDAYEFINKKDYVENWDVEANEVYGIMTFKEYSKILKKTGFKIIRGSKEILNPWIKKNRFLGKVAFFEMKNKKLVPIEFPATHLILVGEK